MHDAVKAAKACQLVYDGDGDELTDLLSLRDVHTKSWDELFVAVGHADAANWVIFQGTNSVMDWVYNLNAKMIQTPDFPGRVHAGFYTAWRDLDAWVHAKLLTVMGFRGDLPTIFAGHSLGGALATLASYHLNNAGVYSFGSPRVGDAEFAEGYRPLHARHVRQFDPVPWVPFAGTHVGIEIVFPGWGHHIANYVEDVSCHPIST